MIDRCPACNRLLDVGMWCRHEIGKYRVYYSSVGWTQLYNVYEEKIPMINLNIHVVFRDEKHVEKMLTLL